MSLITIPERRRIAMTTDDQIIGAKIKEVRWMTKKEMIDEGWEDSYYNVPAVIVLSSGAIIYPMMDPEGNGPGILVGKNKDGGFYFEPANKNHNKKKKGEDND